MIDKQAQPFFIILFLGSHHVPEVRIMSLPVLKANQVLMHIRSC